MIIPTFLLCDSVIFLFVCCYVYILVIVCKKNIKVKDFMEYFHIHIKMLILLNSNRTVGSRRNKKVQ